MTRSNSFTVRRATVLPGEDSFLRGIVSNLTDVDLQLVYSDWLEDQGDKKRARFLREYVAATKTMNLDDFPSTDGISRAWVRAIGATLVRAIAKHEVSDHRESWLTNAKPALAYSFDDDPFVIHSRDARRLFDGVDEVPIGATKFFGVPDLPPDSRWPRQKDCNVFWIPDSGIEPDLNCCFLGQINFADFADTILATYLPSSGLLSFFSCSEFESIGAVDVCVIYTPSIHDLRRMEPPSSVLENGEDRWNSLLAPLPATFIETVELPYADEMSPFPEIAYEFEHPLHDPYCGVVEDADCDTHLSSLGGYTCATTGSDHLPGADWCKLIAMRANGGSRLHFCIRNDHLKAGRFDEVAFSWIDYDA